ncbi:MAG: GHKL domain-containing protein [Candidatus Cloacimonetes bacterium]|nr:GHKL domain-containing protein [Candidatus Cloacimonadota bacterium]MCF7813101.1 GHKL domain-containing protein [Candidatus Cloacimonadota bacterium]MCF7867549.1 GHKL domain-containing protein [Candidatus Cloacimonadota bacterium]MCF7883057.1 GHKL domain-containing protein [Candidatus Cloacimonadota bacterium]
MSIDDVKPKKKINIEVEPKELENRIDEIFYSSVKALSFAVTFLFLIFAIAHLTMFNANMMTVLQTVMSFLLLFAVMNLVMSIKMKPKYSHLLGTIILGILLFNSIQYIKFTGDIIYIIYIILLIIGCGIFYLSFKWYFISIIIILLTVVHQLILNNFTEYWKDISVILLLSFYVSFLANYLRIKSTRNFQTLFMLSHKHEKELEKAMVKIESINTELKDFAYIVSHDLKAPLRGINSLATWLVSDYEDKFDEDGKEQLNLLKSRVKRMDRLINGVLEYSRIGRLHEEHVELDLSKTVPDIIDLLAPPKNMNIEIVNVLPTVKLEKTRIKQIFQNLLSNALKYIDKPKGEIKIGCEDNAEFWKFSVSDNGPGIAEKDYDKIFKIFHMLQPRDQNNSTGVGLTVIKKIVEMYGGKVWLNSKLGEGTTFYFTLPKMKTEE